LAHGERDDARALGRELVERENASRNVRHGAGVLAHRELLAKHLRRRQSRADAAETAHLLFAAVGGHVVEDHRAEGIEEGHPAALERVRQLVGTAPRERKMRGELA